jgi:molybdopterin converting factor small subunit
MMQINVRLLGGLHKERASAPIQISLPENATVADLTTCLQSLDIVTNSNDIIISLSGRGISQWSPNRLIQSGEEVVIFPHISGGGVYSEIGE